MEHLGKFSCHDCNMEFHSASLLDKHKARFCIGSDLGDPIALRKNRLEITKQGKTALGFPPRKTKTPDLICVWNGKLSKAALSSLRGRQTSPPQHTTTEGPPALSSLRGRQTSPPQHTTTEGPPALSQFTEEFYKLRMTIEENLPRRQKQGLSAGSQWLDDERLWGASEHHEQKLAEMKAYATHLEQQREQIEQQLTVLASQGSRTYLEKLLQDLREHELRNEKLLCQLSTHLEHLWRMKESNSPSELLKDKKTHANFDLMSSLDGLLSTQIRSLRLAYMQAGGADPEVLAHMHDLQAEAYNLEQVKPKAEHNSGGKRQLTHHRAIDSDIWVIEQENQKLEEEILRMQLARQQRKGDEAGSDRHLIPRHHIDEIAILQAEVFNLRREVERGRERPAPAPPTTLSGHHLAQISPTDNSSKQHWLLGKHVLDSVETLGPALYDLTAGFIIFYDIVLGVDPTFRALSLVARLYYGGQEMGQPTPMPAVQCRPAGDLAGPSTKHSGDYALLAFKQPVPRTRSSPALSLVVEVHTPRGLGSQNEKESQGLVPQGWARLLLFDQHKQLQTGFWRVPFRALPVRPLLSTDQLNSVPQLGDMEICLRVVNARDGDIQCLAKIEPDHTSHYKHPPVIAHAAILSTSQTHLPMIQCSSSPIHPSRP
ncbi:coiled-coil domain-containing protein 17 [Brachyhypopomus gauderio]|uniref:coiled-coil domain-containing protein 17 n=1 Tax=Brachyhypopomus gauderio TaxID=698409 RepID=UPI00404361CB